MLTCRLLRHVSARRLCRGISTEEKVKNDLRNLLRHSAQPVAVVTSLMRSTESEHLYHGATLSSFTSIAMEPHPLVAFSLRIPSRMSHSLNAIPTGPGAHMVVNILSADQAETAIAFSRPDKYPDPFTHVSFSLSEDRIPILDGALGALSCVLVSRAIPLHDLAYLASGGRGSVEAGPNLTSELYLAQVTNVEKVVEVPGSRRTPLLYLNRRYTTSLEP